MPTSDDHHWASYGKFSFPHRVISESDYDAFQLSMWIVINESALFDLFFAWFLHMSVLVLSDFGFPISLKRQNAFLLYLFRHRLKFHHIALPLCYVHGWTAVHIPGIWCYLFIYLFGFYSPFKNISLISSQSFRSPYTASDSNKLESVQRRAARWVTRDYRYTSSVSAMLQDLKWHTLDQGHIASRLVLLYKVTYDLVAIPATDYLVRNTRPSTRTFSCIQTDLDSERLLQVHILSPHYHPLECPTSPHTCPPYPDTDFIAVCQVVHSTP